ncbi:hypothetical protein WJX73_010270 [Symbiochloris irregularis]|uniref:SET domain-containing protein n=1 Tax=Symbiochloris irregularis TaxID=706552 RepID=A0AAW1Q029_9CHLO
MLLQPRSSTGVVTRPAPAQASHCHARSNILTNPAFEVRPRSLGKFEAWLLQQGVQGLGADDSSAAFYEHTSSGMRGAVAVQDIKAGSTLVSIPYKTLFRECTPVDPEPSQVLEQLCNKESLGHLHLGLVSRVLRHLANSTSEWRPYLEVLSRSGARKPFLLSREGVLQSGIPMGLLTPSLLSSLDELNIDPRTSKELQSELSEAGWGDMKGPDLMGDVSSQDAIWAMQVATARAFLHESRTYLVPLFDMLQHRGRELGQSEPLTNVHGVWPDTYYIPLLGWRRSNPKPLRLVATRNIRKGEDLVHSYHEPPLPSINMLARYGFVPFMSEAEEVALFSDEDEALAWIQEQGPFLEALQDRLSQISKGAAPEADLAGAHHSFSFSTRNSTVALDVPDMQAFFMALRILDPPLKDVLSGEAQLRDHAAWAFGLFQDPGRFLSAEHKKAVAALRKQEKLTSKAVPGTLLGSYRDGLRPLPRLMFVRRCWDLLHNQVAPLEEDLRTLASAASCFPLDLRSVDFSRWLPACKQIIDDARSHLDKHRHIFGLPVRDANLISKHAAHNQAPLGRLTQDQQQGRSRIVPAL